MLGLLNIQTWDELEGIPNYNDTIHNALQGKGLSGFSYLFLMILMKNFFQRIYEPMIKKSINILLLKGKFFSSSDQKELTEHFYSLELIVQQFELLQQDFDSGEMYMRDVIRFATAKRIDLSMKNLVSRYIAKIESHIENIVERVLTESHILAKILEEACNDWLSKDKGPTLVQNIREIDGIKNEAFYSELSAASSLLKHFLELTLRLPNLQRFAPKT